MSSYVDTVLIKDEVVMFTAATSRCGHSSGGFFPGCCCSPRSAAGLLLWLWAWLVYRVDELAVTNKRIIVKSGLIQRNTD